MRARFSKWMRACAASLRRRSPDERVHRSRLGHQSAAGLAIRGGWANADHRAGDAGIALVRDGDFGGMLSDFIGDWTDGRTPLVLAGMIGSRNGWREAPYLSCPAELDALAAAAIPLDTDLGPAWIIPGLECLRPAGFHDVMRGEEVQIAGAGSRRGHGRPARHPQQMGRPARGKSRETFRTFMTGELFALLKTHSLLGRLFEEGPLMTRRSLREYAVRLTIRRLRRCCSASAPKGCSRRYRPAASSALPVRAVDRRGNLPCVGTIGRTRSRSSPRVRWPIDMRRRCVKPGTRSQDRRRRERFDTRPRSDRPPDIAGEELK